jgi:FlaA1/EpsC-like NDP-sugar epimerase
MRSSLIVLLQALLIVSSAALAWLLRFDFTFPHSSVFLWALPLLLLLRLAAMARFNLFHGYWRYTGMSDAEDIVKAVLAGSVGFLIAERWIIGEKGFPISIYVIEALLTAVALGTVRMSSRAFMQIVQNHTSEPGNKTVIVIGAGCAGMMLLQELPRSGYTALALVDDDPAKAGVSLHGVQVVGNVNDLPTIAKRYSPDELIIAIPSATREQMCHITELCHKSGVRFRTIPGLADLLHGTVTIDQLREVNLEDLLGRVPVDFKLDSVQRSVAGKVVMVTGAAGSIGSELFHQLLSYAPTKLVCVDQAETPLFFLQQANLVSKVERAYCVADITDTDRMRDIIEEHEVRAIFHAAAYKHVPLMEDNLQEAVKNNVFGLLSLMEVAERCGCEDFLLISSDKAVNPTSFMGCTKRLGELIVASRAASPMRSVSVRFGNVLGSQGSVVPIFQEQIRTTQRITITHPEITRFFMTIPEAVSLVLQAFAVGKHGDVLVLDMGEPMRIVDLARTLIRLSGKAEEEIDIVFTELRPGEKLYEELFYCHEKQMPTSNEKVMRASGQLMSWTKLFQHLEELRVLIATGSGVSIRSKVRDIIPEYSFVVEKTPLPQDGLPKYATPQLTPRAFAAAAGAGHVEGRQPQVSTDFLQGSAFEGRLE